MPPPNPPASMSPNDRKLHAAASMDFEKTQRVAVAAALTWLRDENSTYQNALDLCAPVPPVIREGEAPTTATKALTNKERSSVPLLRIIPDDDWVDRCIISLQSRFQKPYPESKRSAMVPFITTDRFKPQTAEIDERVTDHFHLKFILEPAAAIAGSVLEEELTATFAPRSQTTDGSTIGDVQVTTKEGRQCYLTAEDKRGRVFLAHGPLLRRYINSRAFPWPSADDNPAESIRIWIQASSLRLTR